MQRKQKKSCQIAYAEIKGRICGAKGHTEGLISRETPQGNPQRPHGMNFGASFGTVYSCGKTAGREDCTGYTVSGGDGTFYTDTIHTGQYEDFGNKQGADTVIRRLVSAGSVHRLPSNPTKISSITGRYTGTQVITPGQTATISVSGNIYDCTSWGYYYDFPKYDYVGIFKSGSSPKVTPITTTVTCLASG